MVSVIIPIYNTGEYLRQCIASICKQSYTDLQIIMVDDGSDSDTAALCDEIAASDSRIVLIHKRNEGVSIARNTGLDMAEGDVVCFVDSDDTISSLMVETLVDTLTKTDTQIVVCDAVTINPGHPDEIDTIAGLTQSCTLSTSTISPAMLARLAGSACRCAYKRTDKRYAALRFPAGIKFSEDRIYNIAAMGMATKIAYIKTPFYNRLIRPGSACFRFYPDMTEQIVEMRAVLLDTVMKYWGHDYVNEYERQVAGQILYAVTNFTAPYNTARIKDKLSSIRQLCDNERIRECMANAGFSDIRSRLLSAKAYHCLFSLGILTNLKHKLCHTGQYQQ